MPYGTLQADKIQGSINSFSPDSVMFRNRIINGAMVIAQRGTGTTSTAFINQVDQFQIATNSSATFTFGQSSTAPTGFIYSALNTNTSAATLTGTNYYSIRNVIEGLNIADLGWGTANAKTVTLSFWVRSSLTGTFGGSILNGSANYSYPFTYTISAADTFEYKTITIAGPTAGTWATDNGTGMFIEWALGTGSTYLGTAGVWAASRFQGATGQVQLSQTNGATFYITGVQLEVGSTATSFDYRPYGTEFMLCQRYLPAYRATGSGNQDVGNGLCNSTTSAYFAFDFVVQPRVEPTGITISSAGHFGAVNAAFSATNLFTGLTFSVGSLKRALLNGTGSSGLVQGNATMVRSQSSSAYILFDGCEL